MALLDSTSANIQQSDEVATFDACAFPESSPEEGAQSLPALRFRNVSFTYASELESVRSRENRAPQIGPVNWSVAAGSFTLLLGNTGAGKTTLLRMCKPEITPAGTLGGTVEAFGAPISALDAAESACTVGYVAQSPENQLVCDSVWHELAFGLENLGIPQQTMRKRVAEVAHFFGIEPWFHRSTSSLSGGQKQLLNLASVLVMRPRILLLDEPTAQLDPIAEKNFLHALFRLNRELGITVVVATHRPEAMAAYATAQFNLSNGSAGNTACCQSASTNSNAGTGQLDAIKLKDVFFRYEKGSSFVLRSCDVRISAGSIHAIVGGNGSGKSTLLNVIAGCAKPERGSTKNALASNMALLPQDPAALFACDSVADEAFEWLSDENRLFLARNDAFCPFLEPKTRNHAQNKAKTSIFRQKTGDPEQNRGRKRTFRPKTGDFFPLTRKTPWLKAKNEQKSHETEETRPAATEAAYENALNSETNPMSPEANTQQHNTEHATESNGSKCCCPATGKAALDLIESCGLENALRRNPLDLSGGQRQLLALAKVLFADPSLLLLDEPTKGLDSQAKCAVANALAEAQENGVTVVMVTHDLAFAARTASTTSMLFDGGITCTQPTQEFFEENYFYRPVEDAFYRTWTTPAAAHAAKPDIRNPHGEASAR